MNRLLIPLLIPALIAGCAVKPTQTARPLAPSTLAFSEQVPPFSLNSAGGLPKGWSPLIILRDKKPTDYRLVNDGERTVLHARADRASSALMHALVLDPGRQPWLQWQWKIKATARVTEATSPSDRGSPVRIVLGFDGDKDRLPFAEQIMFETARLITGHDFPYATLMYVWGQDLPVGAVVPSRHSSRIRMVVVESGYDGIGSWRQFSRNIVEDFERAFGERPGRLLGVGVLTDDDVSGEATEAWYGDILLSEERPASLAGPESPTSNLFLTKSQ